MPHAKIGQPLPRAADTYVEEDKWNDYVRADDGHGKEWRRVFRLEPTQSEELWLALADLARTAPISEVRPSRFGVGCGMTAELTFNGRTAVVLLGWYYDRPGDAPRLVTAYPAP